MIDYSDVYDKYWRRPDRLGESSFKDAASLARQILDVGGPGRMLDIGSGMGALVQELLKHGVDAHGVDVSAVATEHCNLQMPGRFHAASVLALPFEDASFDTVLSTDCLAHLEPAHVALALAEMRRVCRRNLFLCVATEPDREGHGYLTVEKRGWWENAAFAAGFRKHPRYYAITPFHALETEGNSIVIPLEAVPEAALVQYPLAKLLEHRDLHMDMSRESGRRSDAHMARYHAVAGYIRDGDTVLDAACGMGYGSHLLAWQSGAARVIGADLDEDAISYATQNFCEDGRMSFRLADAQQLHFLDDNSVDLFVSFETLEHVPHPEKLIAEANRILRPGGRFIASVPNRWVNEHGVDPNPYHLHVYDWQRLVREIQSCFLLETAFAQTAGGGMVLADHSRALYEFAPDGEPPDAAEWWLIVGMKDPVASAGVGYKETALHWSGMPPNVVAFERDYENPWLIRGLVNISWRNRNPRQRSRLAERVLEQSSVDSPDSGAALCVLAYGLLEAKTRPTPQTVSALATTIDAYVSRSNTGPQSRRWTISLLYVNGLLWRSIGRHELSLASFKACAAHDALGYSPLLATKTVDACRLAGLLSFHAGDRAAATDFWTKGINLAERALQGDWREIRGDMEHPFTFGLREAAQVLDSASACADGLHHLKTYAAGRGLTWGDRFHTRDNEGEGGGEAPLAKVMRDLATLRASPAVRLQKAVQSDPVSFRRFARISYLLAVILMPARLKTALRPISAFINRRFK